MMFIDDPLPLSYYPRLGLTDCRTFVYFLPECQMSLYCFHFLFCFISPLSVRQTIVQ
jgi:hypothetical protein